jgi:beta-glucanase (GH16 family)
MNEWLLKKRGLSATLVVLLTATMLVLIPSGAVAVPDAEATVIDDFEDADASDWGFFGGNAAGGGGGVLSDRPYEGSFYFNTGWGGEGSASGFYGGMFKNYPDVDQVTPPADAWFNVWVLNQGDATVDAYTLEITIREDLDGNGWTTGEEDSFRLDTTFASSDFDDEWTLVSAPLSDLTDLATGGDGTFDGALDEIVVVVAGVSGAGGSTVEVDFDLFGFSSGGPLALDEVVFDDMEHANPAGNGWFSFNGSGGGGIGPNDSDLPPANGGTFSLETGWGSGNVPGFYGGFGRTNPSDLSGTEYFNFWINPDGGQDYALEINLQDDDNGDGAINQPDDDEFQYNCVIAAAGPCAISGGGWQLVSIPLDDFFDDGSFLFGGNGVLDPTSPTRGGNGELINVVIAVIGNDIGGGVSTDVNFRTDYWTFSLEQPEPPAPDKAIVIDDFEHGIAPATNCPTAVLPLGFCTFNGAGSSVTLVNPSTSDDPPAPSPPGIDAPNSVLEMNVDSTSFAGFIHGFSNPPAFDTWIPQNWSASEGIAMWFFGTGSGSQMFIDILDNRNPDSTTDDAERFSVAFADDFVGWQQLEFPFSSFVRKEVGNGAPNDGLTLFEMHGYAVGTLNSGGPRTYFIDDVILYGVAEPPSVAVQFSQQNTFIDEGTTEQIGVKLNRPLGPDDPAQVSIDFGTERSYAIPYEEFTPTSGTLTFVNGGSSELFFPIETFDDTKFEGDEQIVIRLTNPVDVERGALFQGSALIDDNDPFDPKLLDDFEQGAFLWDTEGPVGLDAVRSESGGPDARPGQDAVEKVGAATVPLHVEIDVEGRVCNRGNGVTTVNLLSTSSFDATTVDHATVTLGQASEAHTNKDTGEPRRHVEDVNRDGRNDLVFHFRFAETSLPCNPQELSFNGATFDGHAITAGGSDAALIRDFPLGQDWTGTKNLSFWYRGAGGSDEITVTLKDNRAPDPDPSGWTLAWADEFDDSAGTPPNPANWAYEIGDTTPDGKNGWGNEERQYYTDDPANAATDGSGNLVITLDEADGSQECYYGPCEFESARLITQNKAEFAYGRIESRIQVPTGGEGLWPAFWSLGTDIRYNPWPGAGEIDVMEYVSRIPNEIFGTIHGPGYSGGGSFSGIYDFGERVDPSYHTFAIEWEPDLITWYVDGTQYHQAEPSDVSGPWVFEKPFFLLLNFAIGGNFGGAVDPANTYPQEYLVDYVRVYQGPDTAERFEASFTDDVAGWTEISVPITDFVRSTDQPAGAPSDGLNLNEIWGYGFEFPEGTASGRAGFDLVRRVPIPPPTEFVVSNLDDAGPGSLREALVLIADDGTITFDPGLAGGTLTLTSGQLTIDSPVTVDASAAAPVTISAGGASRALQVQAGAVVAMNDLVIRDGVAAPQGGGILNFGELSLDRVVVTDNTENSSGPAIFDLGGGGIYNGDGSVLNLTDSTVSNNTTVNQPGGGIYGFFNATITITSSTVSNNLSGDVAGGLRSLTNSTIINSTFSGNTSTAWHGGGIFHTDGQLTVTNSTFAGNVAPAGTASGILVATFGAPANATLTNNVIEGNGGAFACAIEGGGAATITSGGANVISDGSCSPIGSDMSSTNALVGPLADNGGATLTHALLAGSPAIDAADAGACPAVDQRGVNRPQGAGCDVGAVEVEFSP